LTGYNHGPSGVLRLTKKYRTRELGELVQNVTLKKRFGFASRNFYASFLAALEVTSNAPKYLGTVSWSQTLESVDIKLKQSITYQDVLRWFEGDDLKAQIYNPQITKIGRNKGKSIPANVVVSVPKAKVQIVMHELETPGALKQARLSVQN
jgi:membrane-bound lytic murein transglycosylase D